jgi:hypothetical protein
MHTKLFFEMQKNNSNIFFNISKCESDNRCKVWRELLAGGAVNARTKNHIQAKLHSVVTPQSLFGCAASFVFR